MSLCYSTDPRTQREIDNKKPKYRPTDRQKLQWSIEDCRRFGSTYQGRVEMSKTNGQFNKNHHDK